MTKVSEIRNLNNTPPYKTNHVLECERCEALWSGDLARYHCSYDDEVFLCSDCDGPLRLYSGPDLGLCHLPITQRTVIVVKDSGSVEDRIQETLKLRSTDDLADDWRALDAMIHGGDSRVEVNMSRAWVFEALDARHALEHISICSDCYQDVSHPIKSLHF